MTSKPSVSIIIPTWNRSRKVLSAINSCLNQTYYINEIIIVDDGSSDDTKEIIAKLQIQHPNIKYVYQTNQGSQKARNNGIKNASSELIGFLDSDDEYLPEKIEKQVAVFLSEDVDIVSCYMKRVFDNGQEHNYSWVVDENALFELLKYKTYVDNNSALFKRICFEKIKFDENCKSSQEWDLHISMAQKYKYQTVKEVLSVYHMQNTQSNVFRSAEVEFNGIYYVLTKHRKIWIKTIGKEDFNKLCDKLLTYRYYNSKNKITKFISLIKLNSYFLRMLFQIQFYKSLIKSILSKN
jgi:glycosyltransferase involved in cell wall biosynthesis